MLFDDELRSAGGLPRLGLTCGDPARAARIAERLEHCRELEPARGMRAFIGSYGGQKLVVASHGVGSPGSAIVFERMVRSGVTTIIRIGTAGSLQPDLADGELVIASAAVRLDGLTDQLVPPAYPAVADPEVTLALERTAAERGRNTRRGIVLTNAAFYPEQLALANNAMSAAGVLAVEMECAAMFVIASLRQARAGCILAIDGPAIDFDAAAYAPDRDVVRAAIEAEIEVALEAAAYLKRTPPLTT